ncbi:polyisoprenoid-binding protein YceI [Pararhizobium capsulatum DSM 1112]|uniref:Polyisoprenoid-binding protein YceI n=1 Tax=Pararhizobium capsulatum DSM 1112 TaxID=1121113 RepID=A0ABU0BTA7_9HYPH|nr:YceI family protein [Pararhizobium capsulatum]MDQ0320092.1 polyisoprenoid-binding protein YceI [Pararhizobium capsulatum DSM 1112]
MGRWATLGTVVVGLVLLAATPGWSRTLSLDEAAGRYSIDGSSRIGFSVGQVGGGGISGNFSKFSGTFKLDQNDIRRSVVEFSLFPEAVETGEPRVESFLRSRAIFDAEHFPQIVFRSTKITQTGEDTAEIEGKLTAKGTTRTEHFEAKLTKWNARVISFRIEGSIFRAPYNMAVSIPIYSNVVQFNMTVNGMRR